MTLRTLLISICVLGFAGGLGQIAVARPTYHQKQHRVLRCTKRPKRGSKRRCKVPGHAGKRNKQSHSRRTNSTSPTHTPPSTAPLPSTPAPGGGPVPTGPACPVPTLPSLPTGHSRSEIIGGIMWLSGGPAGTCGSNAPTPLAGTIIVQNKGGIVIATDTIGEGEFFDIQIPPGEYIVSGTRNVPAPLELGCGPPTSSTTFTAGQPVAVVEGAPTDVYCAGDIS